MTEKVYYQSKDWKDEVYTCSTKDCPHALHRMSVEEYKNLLIKQAKEKPSHD